MAHLRGLAHGDVPLGKWALREWLRHHILAGLAVGQVALAVDLVPQATVSLAGPTAQLPFRNPTTFEQERASFSTGRELKNHTSVTPSFLGHSAHLPTPVPKAPDQAQLTCRRTICLPKVARRGHGRHHQVEGDRDVHCSDMAGTGSNHSNLVMGLEVHVGRATRCGWEEERDAQV